MRLLPAEAADLAQHERLLLLLAIAAAALALPLHHDVRREREGAAPLLPLLLLLLRAQIRTSVLVDGREQAQQRGDAIAAQVKQRSLLREAAAV